MTRLVFCKKLGKEAPGLETPPFPGNKGQYIFDNVSQQAWNEWIAMQTMIINEQRLASFDPKAKQILESEREKFLFSNDFVTPEGYIPPAG